MGLSNFSSEVGSLVISEALLTSFTYLKHWTKEVVLKLSRGELSYLAPLGSENISVPYFKQCFFQGGGIIPQTVKHHASQSQERNNKYFILYYFGFWTVHFHN